MTHSHLKTVAIANEVVLLGAIVVAEYLFIQVPEQVEWLNVDVCTLQSTLQETPEVLKPVRMNLPVNVAFRMVHNRMPISVVIKSVIRCEVVRVDRATRLDMSADFRFQFMPLAAPEGFSANLAAPLKDADNSRLAFAPASQNNFASPVRKRAAPPMNVSSTSTSLPGPPTCIVSFSWRARRTRCIMNHADF